MKKIISILILTTAITSVAFSQKIYFAKANYTDSALLQKSVSQLAQQSIKLYKNANQETYLDNLFRLQFLAGNYAQTSTTLNALNYSYTKDSITPSALGFPYKAYCNALATNNANNKNFTEIYTTVFNQLYNQYNDENKLWVSQYFDNSLAEYETTLDTLIAQYKNNDSIEIDDAVKFCRAYLSYKTYAATQIIAKQLLAKIEEEKYIVQDSVLVTMPDGGIVAVTVVRSKTITAPQPVILMYNIYAGYDVVECKTAVARGYVGVIANTRGKRLSPNAIEPFEHDAKDGYYILDWISKQTWCNGKIGMYGGSYLGFSQWSTAKYMHPALKTMIPQVSVGIGIDYPMHNNIFMSYALRWIHFVTDNKLTNSAAFNDNKKWNKALNDWYKSGKSFKTLDSIEGNTNNIFQRWLQHPSYDSFWQNMTPQKQEFAKINIPIFTTTGYWDDDQTGAMYYYKEYMKWNKNPNYYVLIGPYSHSGAQGYPKATLNNYTIDSVANIPIIDIVFKWFDYTLKDSAKPAILKDKITFEIMGKNEWKSVASLSQMANDTLSLYLTPTRQNNTYTLSNTKPTTQSFIAQTVDLKDRNEAIFWGDDNAMGSYPFIIDSTIKCEKEKLIFVSNPMDKPVAISGAIQAAIVASINKKDMDIVIDLFEQTPDGKYFALNQNLQRASYAKSRSKRQLLTPNKIETISVNSTYITCKQLQKGSRIVVVMGINKNPNWQINYGTGKDVSLETINDATISMQIKWYSNSCIKIPILKD